MPTAPTTDSAPPSRRLLLALTGAAAAVVVVAVGILVLRSDDGDTVEAAETPATTPTSAAAPTEAPPTTPVPTTAPTTPASADDLPAMDLAAWIGTYTWTEVAEASGSELSVVHELTLDAVTNSGQAITGGFTQTGESVETDLRVRANPSPAGTGIAVELIEIDRGKGIEVPGDVLFELTGDPAAPTTSLRDLVTLRIDHPAEGTYFLPVGQDTADDEVSALPATFWAIEDETYDLVSVETTSGEVVRRVAGWGPLSDDPELLDQALVGVDAGPAGIVWVSDCCEPAIGGLFVIGPETTALDDAVATAFGVAPQLSPDGRRAAVGVLEQGVQVNDAATGEVMIAPELTGSVLVRPGDAPGFPQPLGWVDDEVVAVAITDFDVLRSTITFVDVGDPAAPRSTGSATLDGFVRDGTIHDGLVSAVVSASVEDRAAELVTVDPASGAEVQRTDLVDGTVAVEYDPSGVHRLELTDEGDLTVSTLDGEPVPLAGRYLDISW